MGASSRTGSCPRVASNTKIYESLISRSSVIHLCYILHQQVTVSRSAVLSVIVLYAHRNLSIWEWERIRSATGARRMCLTSCRATCRGCRACSPRARRTEDLSPPRRRRRSPAGCPPVAAIALAAPVVAAKPGVVTVELESPLSVGSVAQASLTLESNISQLCIPNVNRSFLTLPY